MKRILLFTLVAITSNVNSQILINEIYGGGGNSGATWNKDVIQLINVGSNAEALTGWAIQYASATGNSWNVDGIPDVTINPGETLNVLLISGANGIEPPTPSIQATALAGGLINMSVSAGKVALTNNTTQLTGSGCPTTAVDYVGYGSTATCGPNSTGTASGNTQGYIRTDTNVPGSFDVNTTPLPVKLSIFEVRIKNKVAYLNWTTLSEINNSHFIIEHSINGKRFNEIGKVEGSGNSSREINYEFVHNIPVIGINYYRITQVDYDGKSETFDVRWVKVERQSDIKIYPYQVQDKLFVDGLEDSESIFIYNSIGSLMNEYNNVKSIDMSNYLSGIYFIKVGEVVQKIFKN